MDQQDEHNSTLNRPGEDPGRPIPVVIVPNGNGGFEDQIAHLNAQLAADKARTAHELDSVWARDQQRTSIALFRIFAGVLLVLFLASLVVLLFSYDERQIHVATIIIEIITAAIVAGYLGYMLAKPFEHRR